MNRRERHRIQKAEQAFTFRALACAMRAGVFDWPVTPRNPVVASQSSSDSQPNVAVTEQHDVVHNIVERHLLKTMNGERPPQLLLIVRGEAGSGKTELLKRIADTFDRHGQSSSLAITSCSPAAADVVGGTTVKAWADIAGTPSRGGGAALRTADDATRARVQRARYIAIDDAAMLGASLLVDLDARLTSIRTPSLDGVGLFGEANVLLFADWFQKGRDVDAVYASLPSPDARLSNRLRVLFGRFQTATTLAPAPAGAWREMLHRFRAGECTPADDDVIKSLVMEGADGPDFTVEPWRGAPLLANNGSVIDVWNRFATERFKGYTGCTIFSCTSTDSCSGERLESNLQQKVDELPLNVTAHRPRTLRLAVGMPVLVPFESTRLLGRIVLIELDDREPANHTVDSESGDIVLHFPPAAVICRSRDADLRVRIVPSTGLFDFNGVSLRRTQLMMKVAFAMTFGDARGRTFNHVVVDLAKPPRSRTITFEETYFALSRVRSAAYIRLLRPLERELQVTVPDTELIELEARLDNMARSHPISL